MNPTAIATAAAASPALASALIRIAQKQAARYEAILDRPNVDSKILQAECRMLVSVVRAVQSLQPRASSTKSAPTAPAKHAPAPTYKPQHTPPPPAPQPPKPASIPAPKLAPPQVPTDPTARFGPQPGEPIITPPAAPGLTPEQRQARFSADLARATGFYKADELEAAARALGA